MSKRSLTTGFVEEEILLRVVGIAFGYLKAWWRWLLKQNNMFAKTVLCVVSACCMLHIRRIHGDAFHDDWIKFDVNSENENEPATSTNSITTYG